MRRLTPMRIHLLAAPDNSRWKSRREADEQRCLLEYLFEEVACGSNQVLVLR